MNALKNLIKNVLPKTFYYQLLKNYYYILSVFNRGTYTPPVGYVNFGDFRRLRPFNESFGWERGNPIDRHYIEQFLSVNTKHIQGRVLEIGDDYYTYKFGTHNVSQCDILNLSKDQNPKTTIVADLASAPQIPSDTFDCIVFTQTLMLVYDSDSAVRTLYRILKPGGIILATFSGISQTHSEFAEYWCWHFTSVSAMKLFNSIFSPSNVEVKAYGNFLSSISFLAGLASKELTSEELNYRDPAYEVIITVKASKPAKY